MIVPQPTQASKKHKMRDFYITESQNTPPSILVPPQYSRSKLLFTENRIYTFEEVIDHLEQLDPANINVVFGNQTIPILSKHDYPLLSKLFVVGQEAAILSRLEVK